MITGAGDATGTFTAATQTVTMSCADATDVAVQLAGTFTLTVTFEVSNDDGTPTNWFAVGAVASSATALTTAATTGAAAGIYRIDATPYKWVRARCSAFTSGSAAVRITPARRAK